MVLDALERIEVSIRTAVTYHLGMSYGAFAHEDASKFHPQFDHQSWVGNLHAETQRSSDAFVTHYQTKYQGFPTMPIWMMSELISLGSLSRLYRGMQGKDKQAVAAPLRIHHKRLQDWLHVLTYVRNVCAHHSRLWNRELAIRPTAMSEPQWNNPLLPRRDKVFCVLLSRPCKIQFSKSALGGVTKVRYFDHRAGGRVVHALAPSSSKRTIRRLDCMSL